MSIEPSGEAPSTPEPIPEPGGLPPSFRAALDTPPVPPTGWQEGVAPAFLALGLSVVFLDRLAPSTLLVGGLGPSVVGAGLGGLLAYWCLYYAPAIWGARTRRPLAVVSASTFGARGAVVVPGLLLGLVYVIWFAMTIDYATRYTLSGVSAMGLFDPKHLESNHRGSMLVPKPVVLAVAGVWTIASAVIGTLAIRLVSAVMSAYIVFPAIAIGAAVVWAMPTLAAGPIETVPFALGGGWAIANMAQYVFAFLACQGLAAVDWGAASTTEADARKGGIAGVMFAIPILAILALLIVAGAIGKEAARIPLGPADALGPGARPAVARMVPPPMVNRRDPTIAPTLWDAYAKGIGGRIGGVGLMVLGLGLLGPACFCPYLIARQLGAAWPRIPRWAWSILGALATWPLIATGATRDVEGLIGWIGGATAPAVGAIAADYARAKGRWPGPRRGVNLAGFSAWIVGAGAAFAVARWGSLALATKYPPSSLAGFAAAFVVYFGLSVARVEPPAIAIPPVKA